MLIWSEQRCSEDVNKVRKLFCVNLLYLYSYLLCKSVFNLCGRLTQACIDQLLFVSIQVKLTDVTVVYQRV